MSPTVDMDGVETISEKLKFCAMHAAMLTYHNNWCSVFRDNSTSSSSNICRVTQHFYVISDVGEVQKRETVSRKTICSVQNQKSRKKNNYSTILQLFLNTNSLFRANAHRDSLKRREILHF